MAEPFERDDSADETAGELEREPHIQKVGKPIYRGKFDHAQFAAHLHDFKFTRNGDVVVTLVIPFRYRDRGLPLSDAWGVPLSVDIQRWSLHDNYQRQLRTHGHSE